ncbi:hypothetical protein EDB89DRAFT_2242110 [Lactarius sanguifluus]|nr:hypothetical protein EDB89DRAFT_2242110 [Lactarius sanguifluus]
MMTHNNKTPLPNPMAAHGLRRRLAGGQRQREWERWAMRRARGVEGQRRHEARGRAAYVRGAGERLVKGIGVDGGWRREARAGEGKGDVERGERREGVEIDGEDATCESRRGPRPGLVKEMEMDPVLQLGEGGDTLEMCTIMIVAEVGEVVSKSQARGWGWNGSA